MNKLRGVTLTLLIGLLAGCADVQDVPALEPQASKKNLDRAVAAYGALQNYFLEDDGLYLEEYPNTTDNPYSYVWPFSQAMTATVDMTGLPRVGRQYRAELGSDLEALELYWNDATTPTGYTKSPVPQDRLITPGGC